MRIPAYLTHARRCRTRAATLVVTLLVLVLLSTIVVSFMQSVTLERNSSSSYLNRYQAELAAEAGLAQFVVQLAIATRSGDFSVLALTSNSSNATYTALTKFSANGTMSIIPLASLNSTSSNLTLTGNFSAAALFAKTDAAFPSGNRTLDLATTLQPQLEKTGGIEFATSNNSTLIFKCALANMTTSANSTAEFAYIAVDECAKLNAAFFGNNSTTALRDETTVEEFPSRMPIADSGNSTVTSAEFLKFKKLDPGLKSGAVWTSIYDSRQNRKDKNRFYSNHKGELVDFIPSGYLSDNGTAWAVYADGGKPKFDLNKLVSSNKTSSAKAIEISDIISKNLINFYKRDPSFQNEKGSAAIPNNPKLPADPDQLYNRRIAASIVDYIDPDSAPTDVPDDALAGKEQTPYVMQVAERFVWQSSTANATTGTSTIQIGHTVYIQAWNPYSVSANGTLRFDLETSRKIQGENSLVDPPAPISTISGNIPVSLGPNEIKAFQVGSQIINVISSTANLTLEKTDASIMPLENVVKNSRFKTFWNNSLSDQTAFYNTTLFPSASGINKGNRTLKASNSTTSPLWECSVIPTQKSGSFPNADYSTIGDPRQNQINNYAWVPAAYTGGELRWNGYSVYGENSAQTQRFYNTWRNRDSIRELNQGKSPSGVAIEPTSATLIPDTPYNPSINGLDAPFYLRNGNMTSIAELGHIYDPAHLSDSGTNKESGGQSDSNDVKMLSFYAYGGARSLRIGQPEFKYATYDVAGQRAVSLLDLFTANSSASNGKRPSGLNLNTAPKEVLAAFFNRVAQVSDQGQKADGNISYSLSLSGAGNVTQAIIDNRPYYNAADFRKFTIALTTASNFQPSFPTVVPSFPTGTPPTLDVLDRGREEIFRRAYNYMETKSAAFRFYGIGRTLAKNGTVSSQVAIEALVELKASVDSDGNPILRPVVVWKKTL